MSAEFTITRISVQEAEAHLPELAELLRACVADGASVNFVQPFSSDDAAAFWTAKVLPPLRAGTRTVFVAWTADGHGGRRVAGSVQLDTGTPPNQPHRADVTKLLVHPDSRRRGIARALMDALHDSAARQGRTLITLDTATGEAAEPLYSSMGYVSVGMIPGYSLNAEGDGLISTTIMYRQL